MRDGFELAKVGAGVVALMIAFLLAAMVMQPFPPLVEQPPRPPAEHPNVEPETAAQTQERMANASDTMVHISWIQLLLSTVGAAALMVTLWYNVRATRAAESATRLARQSMVDLERAFVFVADVHATKYPDREVWAFQVEWKNSGNTPTRNAITGTKAHLFPSMAEPDPRSFEFPQRGKAAEIHGVGPVLIGPQSRTYGGEGIVITRDDLEKIVAKSVRFFIWGFIEYDDAFGNSTRHMTRFCTEVGVVTTPEDPGSGAISFRVYERFNTADEECDREDMLLATPSHILS